MSKKFKRGFLKADGGSAAIEAVFIIPFMYILYVGTMDVTSFISFNKKLTDIATVTSDAVAQFPNTLTRANITDIENTINLIMPSGAANVQVDVYDYYMNGGTITKRWSTKSPNATNCPAPSTTNLSTLMGAGNDVIVATSCMKYTPWVVTYGAQSLMGAASFNITQTFAAVPYGSTTLKCVTISGGSTLCNEI